MRCGATADTAIPLRNRMTPVRPATVRVATAVGFPGIRRSTPMKLTAKAGSRLGSNRTLVHRSSLQPAIPRWVAPQQSPPRFTDHQHTSHSRSGDAIQRRRTTPFPVYSRRLAPRHDVSQGLDGSEFCRTNLPASRLRSGRRDHLGTPGDIISDCLGDFVGICGLERAQRVKGPKR